MAERMLSNMSTATLPGVVFFCARRLGLNLGVKLMNNGHPLTDETIHEITTWPAAFGDRTMKEIESKCQERSHGIHRRILLGVLTKDSEELEKASEEDPESFFEALKCSASTIAMYKRLVRLLESAHWRLAIVLAAVDMDAPDAPFSQRDYMHAMEVAKAEDDNDLN